MTDPTIYVIRNEVDPDMRFHCDALTGQLPGATELDYVAGDRVSLDGADGVVLTGSTAAVYESESRPWIDDQMRLVRSLVDADVPTLGVCFGHQIVNAALGGTVEHVGTTATLVEATLAEDPLFDGVDPVVVSLHGDIVTEPGDRMAVIAAAHHAPVFGTRHEDAPVWTVQFHPELDGTHREKLDAFGWTCGEFDFGDVSAARLFGNFERIVRDRTP